MDTQSSDPVTMAMMLGFIVSLLGVVYRVFEARLKDRDIQIEYRDKRIEKLESDVEKMADRSASLAKSAETMLAFFIEREMGHKTEDPAPPRGRKSS